MFPCAKNTNSLSVLPAGHLLWLGAMSVDAALRKQTNASAAVLSCSFTLSALSLTFSSQDTGQGFLCLPHRLLSIKTSESLLFLSDAADLGGLSWCQAILLSSGLTLTVIGLRTEVEDLATSTHHQSHPIRTWYRHRHYQRYTCHVE